MTLIVETAIPWLNFSNRMEMIKRQPQIVFIPELQSKENI